MNRIFQQTLGTLMMIKMKYYFENSKEQNILYGSSFTLFCKHVTHVSERVSKLQVEREFRKGSEMNQYPIRQDAVCSSTYDLVFSEFYQMYKYTSMANG